MFDQLKNLFYFPIAGYFAFFAKIQLRAWSPKIIVVTGSNGKTTLLHFIESQLKERAKYSHHANSSFGIPLDILGLKGVELSRIEWLKLFIVAPLKAFKKPFKESLYVVEADSDRPNEGKFLSQFLKPAITLWVSSARTHSMNFDHLVDNGKFSDVQDAIAYEFGHFLENTTELSIINGDLPHMVQQIARSKAPVITVKRDKLLERYKLSKSGTEFKVNKKNYLFNYLLPVENFYSIAMTDLLLNHLGLHVNTSYKSLELPPGRNSIFEGVKSTTIVDSTYNANFSSMTAIIEMFKKYPAKEKWAVLGDMLEQGKQEKIEHEKLAQLITTMDVKRVILMGPRISEHTYPLLTSLMKESIIVEKFLTPLEVLTYLKANIKGGETILFKGARFLDGVIEHLLANKSDSVKLPRREKIWEIRRRKWGL